MKIFSIDPGRLTGLALFDPETLEVKTYEVDARNQTKEFAGAEVLHVSDNILMNNTYPGEEVHVVLEDFILRQGQAVDIVPMYVLGVIDAIREWETYKYSASAHKKGNNAYNISQIIKDQGQSTFSGHATDALSVSLHHWKILNTLSAVEFLGEYKK